MPIYFSEEQGNRFSLVGPHKASFVITPNSNSKPDIISVGPMDYVNPFSPEDQNRYLCKQCRSR